MSNLVQFNNQNLKLINHDNQLWLSSVDVAKALNYSDSNAITLLYSKHKEEFDGEMSQTIETIGSGNLMRKQRIFSREGAWLIGMFARTPKAAEFRRWVLKVLGTTVDRAYPCGTGAVSGEVNVREHTRSLPSGKKEIVLSEKAKTEIGGIVKACLNSQRKEPALDAEELGNRIGAFLAMSSFASRSDDLKREAEELRSQASLREKQADEYQTAADNIKNAIL